MEQNEKDWDLTEQNEKSDSGFQAHFMLNNN